MLELLDVASLDADALVGSLLARGIRPSTEETCQLLDAADLGKSAGALVACATGTYTFEQVMRVGDCSDEDTMGLALARGLNEGLRLSIAQVTELADYGVQEDVLSAAIAQVATAQGGLRPADVMALCESVDEITLTNMIEATAGTFGMKQGKQLCDLLYGDDYALVCVMDHMECSDDRRRALLEEFGADVYGLFGSSPDVGIASVRTTAERPRRNGGKDAVPLLLTGITLARDAYKSLLDKASRKGSSYYDAWGTGPENPMGYTSWDEDSEEDDDAESWT